MVSLTKVKLHRENQSIYLRYLPAMSKGRNKKQAEKVQPSSQKFMKRKIIMIAIIVILGMILYIDSRTHFIERLVGDKTIEIRIKK
jgi:hypothetical protein